MPESDEYNFGLDCSVEKRTIQLFGKPSLSHGRLFFLSYSVLSPSLTFQEKSRLRSARLSPAMPSAQTIWPQGVWFQWVSAPLGMATAKKQRVRGWPVALSSLGWLVSSSLTG